MISVIKIGSSSLHDNTTPTNVFDLIAKQVSELPKGDRAVIVSSSAISHGKAHLNFVGKKKTTSVPEKQALAAVGQIQLLKNWEKAFHKYDLDIGQLLVTNEVLVGKQPEQTSHLKDTFNELFKAGVIPIVNENDAVAVDEIVQGDNDKLSALIANITNATRLFILGTADAIYKDHINKSGRILTSSMDHIKMLRSFSYGTTDPQARGGMDTKLDAAEIFLNDNCKVVYIANANTIDCMNLAITGSIGSSLTNRDAKLLQ